MSSKKVLQAALAVALSLSMMATPVFANPGNGNGGGNHGNSGNHGNNGNSGNNGNNGNSGKNNVDKGNQGHKEGNPGQRKTTANPIMSLPISASPERVRWR